MRPCSKVNAATGTAIPATVPSPNHAVQARPYAGVPFRSSAGIPFFSGRTGTAPHSRLPFLHRPRRFPLLYRQRGRACHSWFGILLRRHLHLPHFPPQLAAQLSISNAVQPRHAQVVPRRAYSTNAPQYLLFAVSLTQRDVREVCMRFLFFVQSLLWTMSDA